LIRCNLLEILCLNGFEFKAIDVHEGLVGRVAIGYLNCFGLGLLLGGEDVVGCGHEGFWMIMREVVFFLQEAIVIEV
jgi:hypothetical protein